MYRDLSLISLFYRWNTGEGETIQALNITFSPSFQAGYSQVMHTHRRERKLWPIVDIDWVLISIAIPMNRQRWVNVFIETICSLPRQVDNEGGEFSAGCLNNLGGNFPSALWGRSSL